MYRWVDCLSATPQKTSLKKLRRFPVTLILNVIEIVINFIYEEWHVDGWKLIH